jgi:hypothetical protein
MSELAPSKLYPLADSIDGATTDLGIDAALSAGPDHAVFVGNKVAHIRVDLLDTRCGHQGCDRLLSAGFYGATVPCSLTDSELWFMLLLAGLCWTGLDATTS